MKLDAATRARLHQIWIHKEHREQMAALLNVAEACAAAVEAQERLTEDGSPEQYGRVCAAHEVALAALRDAGWSE